MPPTSSASRASRLHRAGVATAAVTAAVAAVATAMAVVLLVDVKVAGAGSGDEQRRSIVEYVELDGDQVVEVPAGVYDGGTVAAPHPRTGGPYGGWLVLVAERRGEVVVDLSRAPLRLEPETSRVMFVGFRFRDGSIYADGTDITFWYTEHTFPATEWADQAPNRRRPERGLYRSPDTIHAYSGTTERLSLYGADLHDTCDAIDVTASRDTRLVGIRIWDLGDDDVDPNDICHDDAIDGTGGRSTGLTVTDSWIKGRVILIDAPDDREGGGPHRDVSFEDTWVSDAPSAGFTFTSRKRDEPRGITGRRVDVRSWGHSSGFDRIDTVDGDTTHDDEDAPRPVITVEDTRVATEPPPESAPSPVKVWRDEHPYETWRSVLGVAPAGTDRSMALPIALAGAAVGLGLGVVLLRRRRARRAERSRGREPMSPPAPAPAREEVGR